MPISTSGKFLAPVGAPVHRPNEDNIYVADYGMGWRYPWRRGTCRGCRAEGMAQSPAATLSRDDRFGCPSDPSRSSSWARPASTGLRARLLYDHARAAGLGLGQRTCRTPLGWPS